MWVNRLAIVPDTLHMELRVCEEILKQTVQVCLKDRTDICLGQTAKKKLDEKEERLAKLSAAMGFLMFTITCDSKNTKKVIKIAMNNVRLRKICDGMENLVNIMCVGDEQTSSRVCVDKSVTEDDCCPACAAEVANKEEKSEGVCVLLL
jgi:hypothetical protein